MLLELVQTLDQGRVFSILSNLSLLLVICPMPYAFERQCHPREEHLLPLLVVAGAATENDTCEKAEIVYDNSSDFGNHAVSGYLFG